MINFSNHPSAVWPAEQRDAAMSLDEGRPVLDVPFPAVDPRADESEIEALADEAVRRIVSFGHGAALCQGEFALCFAVVKRLIAGGLAAYAATTERKATREAGPDGIVRQTSEFRFARFRSYR